MFSGLRGRVCEEHEPAVLHPDPGFLLEIHVRSGTGHHRHRRSESGPETNLGRRVQVPLPDHRPSLFRARSRLLPRPRWELGSIVSRWRQFFKPWFEEKCLKMKTKSFERNFKLWKVFDSFWKRPWENSFGCFKWKPWNLELVMRCCNKDHIIHWLLSLFETGTLTNLLPKVPFLITFEISVAIPSSEWLIFRADGNYYIYVGCEKPSCFNVSCFDKFSLST